MFRCMPPFAFKTKQIRVYDKIAIEVILSYTLFICANKQSFAVSANAKNIFLHSLIQQNAQRDRGNPQDFRGAYSLVMSGSFSQVTAL